MNIPPAALCLDPACGMIAVYGTPLIPSAAIAALFIGFCYGLFAGHWLAQHGRAVFNTRGYPFHVAGRQRRLAARAQRAGLAPAKRRPTHNRRRHL
jgi:hypothetical protein